jgi:hypothetical protein
VRQKLFRIPFPDFCCCLDFSCSFFANYSNQKLDKRKKAWKNQQKSQSIFLQLFAENWELIGNKSALVICLS